MRVAALSFPINDGDVSGNTAALARRLDTIPVPFDLVLLPELWTTGFLRESWPGAAREAATTMEALAGLCRDRRIAVAGSIVAPDGASGTLRNRMYVVGKAGDILGHYDKAHLFRPFAEEQGLSPGTSLAHVDLGGFRLGLAVCYDLRFPEMFRNLRIAGADVFIVSAEWPGQRAETLELLARARAVENFCYLALCNRRGMAGDGTEFGGEAVIFGPDGSVVDRAEGKRAWALAELSRAELERTRAFLDILGERSPGTDVIPS